MKKLIIILVICFGVVNAQDSEPNAWKFRWGYSNDLREFEPDTIKQKSILTGFQWGGSINMNDALHNNVWTGGDYNTVPRSPIRKLQLMLQPKWQDRGFYNPGYFDCPFMQYEPTLPLTISNLLLFQFTKVVG